MHPVTKQPIIKGRYIRVHLGCLPSITASSQKIQNPNTITLTTMYPEHEYFRAVRLNKDGEDDGSFSFDNWHEELTTGVLFDARNMRDGQYLFQTSPSCRIWVEIRRKRIRQARLVPFNDPNAKPVLAVASVNQPAHFNDEYTISSNI